MHRHTCQALALLRLLAFTLEKEKFLIPPSSKAEKHDPSVANKLVSAGNLKHQLWQVGMSLCKCQSLLLCRSPPNNPQQKIILRSTCSRLFCAQQPPRHSCLLERKHLPLLLKTSTTGQQKAVPGCALCEVYEHPYNNVPYTASEYRVGRGKKKERPLSYRNLVNLSSYSSLETTQIR